MPTRTTKTLITAAVLATTFSAQAGWKDWLQTAEEVLQQPNNPAKDAALDALSNTDMIAGVKDTLAVGVERAINTLGQKDGFLKDDNVTILLPDHLKRLESPLRQFGQGQMVDDFVTTLNRAAESAVPHVSKTFGNAIRALTVQDVQTLIKGNDTAITDYFNRTTRADLAEKIKPLITKATDEAGVTQYYKQLSAQAGPLMGLFSGGQETDIDNYVTDQALDGLFKKLSQEEKAIRDNPSARTTDILRRVFK